MKAKLTHCFKTKAHDLSTLFENTTKMSQFMRKLERDAMIDHLRYDPLKYVGDGFEFFIELLLSLHPCDNRIGVYNYMPVQENDNGVDGVGVNIKCERSVVQIKYRANTTQLLTANTDHLSNMFSDGMLAHEVVADTVDAKNYRHFVFTTAKGLHHYTDSEMFKSKVKCYGIKELQLLVDNNLPFWNAALKIVTELNNESI